MAADMSRLRTGEKVAGVAAVLLFIDLFLKWYGVQVAGLDALARSQGVSTNFSAWDAYGLLDLFLLVVIIVAIAWAVLTATQRAPALPVAFSVIVTALGALAALLVLYRILNQPGPNEIYSVGYGAILGLLFTIGIAAGGFLGMREEGTGLPDSRRQADGLLGDRERTRPPGTTAPGDPAAPGGPTAPPGGGSTPPPGGAPAGPGPGTTTPPGSAPGTPPQPGPGNATGGEPGGPPQP